MQATYFNNLMSPVRRFAAGTCAVLCAALTLCLGAPPARGANPPTRIMATGAPVQIGILKGTYGGGWDGGESPLGGTFVIGANGDVIIGDGYSSAADAFQITPSGTQTILASGAGGNSHAAAIDVFGNVYIGFGYSGNIYKLPYNAATGTYAGYTAAPTTNCSGGTSDTAACVFAPNLQSYKGISGKAFDGLGNLVIATSDNTCSGAGNQKNNNLVLVCNAACQAETDGKGTNAPAIVYTDTTNIGAIAGDPWGNIFFTDGSNSTSAGVTTLEEITYTSGSYGSAAALESYTNKATYGNGINGVAVGADGTVYFGTIADGIFALPRTSTGGLNPGGIYVVSNAAGGKAIALDLHGNFAFIPYNNGDVVSYLPTGSFELAATAVGATTPATATVTIFDSAGACTPTVTLSAMQFGAPSTEYSAAAGSTCSAAYSGSNGTFSPAIVSTGGSMFTATITFAPGAAGPRNALLTMTDSADNALGTVPLSGVGQIAMADVDPGVTTAFTTGLAEPNSAVADAAGDVFVTDATGKVFEYPAGSTSTTTPTSLGTGFTEPAAIAIDANGDLFVADINNGNGTDVVEIPNSSTKGGFKAGTQTTLISSSTSIGGLALDIVSGMAVGPDGTLYISDAGNNHERVVFFNPSTGLGGVTLAQAAIQYGSFSLGAPGGLAVDGAGNLYVVDTNNNAILIISSAGAGTVVIPPSSISAAWGVAVDPSGNLIVADGGSANVALIPSVSGTLTSSQAITIETLGSPASSLYMDSLGDLYATSQGGKWAAAIQRTAGAINIGSVQDGVTNTGTVYLENAGNESAMLADPDTSQPTNTMFTLNVAGTNACQPGTTGPAGAFCAFQAEFAPPPGTATGDYSGTGQILIATPSLSIPVTISGSAAASLAQANTITWTAPTAGYVGQVVTLSGTSTSTEPVSFASTTTSVCSVNGSIGSGFTVSYIATGKCTVQATVPACSPNGCTVSGALYAAATPVNANITVTDITPAAVPTMVMSQFAWIYPSNAFTDGQNPSGGSFAITQDGEFVVGTSYNSTIYFINAATGAVIANGTNPAAAISFSGPGGITIDSNNNLYFAHLYNQTIYKLPYLGNGVYATLTDNPSPAPPACQGGTKDTAECTFVTFPTTPAPGGKQNDGSKAIAFDPAGNFYMVTSPSTTGTGASYIFECSTSCQPAGTGTLLYSDPNGVSQVAFDPWGNLFFTDANYLESTGNNEGNSGALSSGLYEIPVASLKTLPFTGTPTPLQTFTNTGTPGGYDDILASVAVNQTNGTIYYGVLYDGTFAIPNSQSGGPAVADQYGVSGQGAKALEVDQHGNLYVMANGSGTTVAGTAFKGEDAAGVIFVDNLTIPNAQYLGAATTASATLVDNGVGCGTSVSLAFASTNSDFTGAQSGTCNGIGMGDATLLNPVNGSLNGASLYATTITFNPLTPGAQTSTLTVSDASNGGVGTAAVSSNALTTPQTVSFTAPATTTYTYTPPPSPVTITLTVANGGSNFPVAFSLGCSTTATSPCGAGTLTTTTVNGTNSSATLTVTQAGTIVVSATEPSGLASNNIYYSQSNTATLTLTVNPASQSITFTPITGSPFTYTASPQVTIQLSATGGVSNNPVTFSIDPSSSGAGTVSASTQVGTASLATLTITQAGSIVIDASQAGTANYAPATLQDAQTIQVNQAAQTITFVPITQAIHFITPSAGIAGGIMVPISAIGGASDNAIVFTVDKSSTMIGTIGTSTVSGATSSAVLTIPVQASVVSGTIVIDATQPQSTDYAAVTVSPLATLTIQPPLPTQLITFNNPGTQVVGTALTLSATASSALPVGYTSTTTSVCTVSGSSVSFATGITSASTCTIVAAQPGDNASWAAAPPVTQSFTVNPTGQSPNISVNLSLSTLTIQSGTIGLTQLTIASQNNFTGSLSLSCSGLPSGYTCTFNPSTTSVAEGGTVTTALSVTPPATAALDSHGTRPFIPMTALAVAICFLGFKKRSRLQLLLLVVFVAAALGMISACGGSSTTTTKTTTSTATVTVAASGMSGASGSVQQTASLTVIVQ